MFIFLIKNNIDPVIFETIIFNSTLYNKSLFPTLIRVLTNLCKSNHLIILINMATANNDGFFATQIAQKGAEDPEEAQ